MINFSRLLAVALCAVASVFSADNEVNVQGTGRVRLIPISITGYSGDANSVLRFDLELAGFEIVDAARAQYLLNGRSDGSQVEGRLTDAASKANLLGKAYTGGNTRSQAHALADDVIMAVTGVPGIARTKVVYKTEKANGKSEIFISDYDGHNAVPVTDDNSIVAAPSWLTKKWHIFYTSYKGGFPWVYSHNLTSGERVVFAKYPGLNASPVVSPDGRKVAMVLSKSGSPDIWVANIDGSGLTQITKTKEDESSPCWSPDGTKICFASRADVRRSLFVVPSSGGPITRLNTSGVSNPSEPDWSPDGKTIIFTSQMGDFNICTIPAQGGAAEVITAGEDPSWAPNSRTVIFTRRTGNKRVLSLLDVPTKRVKDTAQISGSRSQPSWAK